VSNHARKVLISDIRVASILHLILISYSAATGIINSGITVLRFIPLSTLILGVFNDAILEIIIIRPLIYSVRWSQLLKNMINILPISGLIKVKRFFYSPTLNITFIFNTGKHSERAQKTKKTLIYASIICLVLLLLIYA
jgi:hypothetical protein